MLDTSSFDKTKDLAPRFVSIAALALSVGLLSACGPSIEEVQARKGHDNHIETPLDNEKVLAAQQAAHERKTESHAKDEHDDPETETAHMVHADEAHDEAVSHSVTLTHSEEHDTASVSATATQVADADSTKHPVMGTAQQLAAASMVPQAMEQDALLSEINTQLQMLSAQSAAQAQADESTLDLLASLQNRLDKSQQMRGAIDAKIDQSNAAITAADVAAAQLSESMSSVQEGIEKLSAGQVIYVEESVEVIPQESTTGTDTHLEMVKATETVSEAEAEASTNTETVATSTVVVSSDAAEDIVQTATETTVVPEQTHTSTESIETAGMSDTTTHTTH